jgi:hypothetical protein
MSPKELHSLIHTALRHWHKPEIPSAAQWETLLLIQQTVLENHRPANQTTAAKIRQVIEEGLALLTQRDEQGAYILKQHFLEQKLIHQIAATLGFSEHTTNRLQAKALERLADIISKKEKECREAWLHQQESALPPKNYHELIGVDALSQELCHLLLAPVSPWLVALAGIGGIGKTVVADHVARHLLSHFHFAGVVWVRVESSSLSQSRPPEQTWDQVLVGLSKHLPGYVVTGIQIDKAQLYHLLKQQPFLVVLDNLEERDEISFLSEQLASWGNPSKFLLTSRAQPTTSTLLYIHPIGELSAADSLKLLEQEAHHAGPDGLAGADPGQLLPIYETVGGNPLALKLVVALARSMPIEAILDGLTQMRTGATEEMYRNIYWKAWRSMSEATRQLLEVMPLISQTGGRPEQMQAASELIDADFWSAVQELTALSLLEARGTPWEPRYGIHRLTETFLKTEIINWPPDNDDVND